MNVFGSFKAHPLYNLYGKICSIVLVMEISRGYLRRHACQQFQCVVSYEGTNSSTPPAALTLSLGNNFFKDLQKLPVLSTFPEVQSRLGSTFRALWTRIGSGGSGLIWAAEALWVHIRRSFGVDLSNNALRKGRKAFKYFHYSQYMLTGIQQSGNGFGFTCGYRFPIPVFSDVFITFT